MSDKIKRAELLARFVHLGQKRRDGEEYINHPKRIVEEYKNIICGGKEFREVAPPLTPEQEDIVCAIWLHDCIEDAKYPDTIGDMIFDYFNLNTLYLVGILTHNKKRDSYNEYIEWVSQYPHALQIKFLDMIDNTSYKIPMKQWQKYHDACIFLQNMGVEIPVILKERLKL